MLNVQELEIKKGSNPEEKFREAVIEALRKILEQKKTEGLLNEYFILQNFGLDISIFMKWINGRCTVRFFELKAYVGPRPGVVGFGNQQGEGPQVNILLFKDSQLKLANQFIRWLLVDGTKEKGSSRFVIFNNIQAKDAAVNNVERGKQNNFRIKSLTKNTVTWCDLLKELENFLTS